MGAALKRNLGFTLIELMIVMAISALLVGMVGPLAMNSVDKANARQELLTVKNWLNKVSHRSFYTGETHILKLTGKQVSLYRADDQQAPIASKVFDDIFFQPQTLIFNNKGFVQPNILKATSRGELLELNLARSINKLEELAE